MYGMISSKTF